MSKGIKHLFLVLPISFSISLCSFALLYFSPGNAAMVLLYEKTGNSHITLEQAKEFSKEKGLDRPFFEMYSEWMGHLAKGDMGTSYVDGKSINEKVVKAYNKTLAMALIATATYLLLGLSIGLYVAVYRKGWMNKIANAWAVLSSSIPFFWLALFFVWIFSVKLGVLETVGCRNNWSLIPPGMLMGAIYTGNIIMVVKEKTILVLEETFVLQAKAMGLKLSSIIRCHVLKNILGPVIALSFLAFTNFMASSILVERIFSISAMGNLLSKAIGGRDYMIVAAGVLIIGITICTANMFSETIYIFIDKRDGGSKK